MLQTVKTEPEEMPAAPPHQIADYNHLPDQHKARGRSSPGFCSTRHSLPSPGTAASVMSEDSGVGSEEDLSLAPDQAWEDVVKHDTEEKEEETGHARSVSELPGCLSIEYTKSYIPP